MPETFLILLCGGVMLAAAVPAPATVTARWLRLAGTLALAAAGLAVFFTLATRDVPPAGSLVVRRVQAGLLATTVALVLAQLAAAQTGRPRGQRAFAVAAYVVAVLAGSHLLHEAMVARGTSLYPGPKPLAMGLQTLACAGAAALPGLVLMDMLLGHAYLTAAEMTTAPFRRLNAVAGAVNAARLAASVGLVLYLQHARPIEHLWGLYGLHVGTRWVVGLLVPAVFLHMAHACVRRRATQSATGILYVAGVLIFVGELIALYLVRETGLPF